MYSFTESVFCTVCVVYSYTDNLGLYIDTLVYFEHTK